MKSLILKGMIAPTFAPMHQDGSLNLQIIPKYADHLFNVGVKGIFVNGTVGEGLSLTVQERKDLAESWIQVFRGRHVAVIIMVGACCLTDTQELAKHAEAIGTSAIAVLPSIYYKPENVEELVEYCAEVALAAPSTPLLYYHFPLKTGVKVPMDEFLEKAASHGSLDTLVGLKYTSLDVAEEGLRCVKLLDGKFAILSGFDETLYESLLLGYEGAINVSFNFLAEFAGRIFLLAEEGRSGRRDWKEEAEKNQQIINEYFKAIFFQGCFNIGAAKVAMRILTNIDVGPTRKPLVPVSRETISTIKKNLEDIKHNLLNR